MPLSSEPWLAGFVATNLNNHTGVGTADEGARVIVRTVLEKEGETGRFFNLAGPIPW